MVMCLMSDDFKVFKMHEAHYHQQLFIEAWMRQICPEMQVNEMHAPYDKDHKVSPIL